MIGFLLLWLTRLLVALFFVGLFGSAIVVVITFFEDGQLLLETDEPPSARSDARSDATGVTRSSSRETF